MTARSQLAGAMIWGVGQALMEETVADVRTSRLAVEDLADYHVHGIDRFLVPGTRDYKEVNNDASR